MRGICALFVFLLLLAGCSGDEFEVDHRRGLGMLYDGRYEDAESHFLSLARDLGQSQAPADRLRRAMVLYQAGRIEHLYLGQPRRAVARLREALKLDPAGSFSFDAHREIAFIFYDRLRDYRTAALEFERLVHAFPKREGIEEFQYRIAQSNFMIREFNQARTEARLLLENHRSGPIATEAMLLVANSYYVEGRYQQASEAHLRLLDLHPEVEIESRSLFELGMCFQEMGDHRQAEKYYLIALKKHPRPDLVKIQLESLQSQAMQEDGTLAKTARPIAVPKARPAAVKDLPRPKPVEKKAGPAPKAVPKKPVTIEKKATLPPAAKTVDKDAGAIDKAPSQKPAEKSPKTETTAEPKAKPPVAPEKKPAPAPAAAEKPVPEKPSPSPASPSKETSAPAPE